MKQTYILRKLCPTLFDVSENVLRESGYSDIFARVTVGVTAPVLFCYVSFVLETASKRKIKRIYFLARDGYIMKRIGEKICAAKGYDIECRYLYCSRFTLKNALYHICENESDLEASGIFGRCARQTAANTLSRAAFSDEQRRKVYIEIGFDKNENEYLDNAQFQDFCTKLKKSEAFCDAIKENSLQSYSLLMEYLEQEGLFDGTSYAFCDTGWLGSIQSAAAKLIKGKAEKPLGFYFGLFRNTADENGEYIPFLFSAENAYKIVPCFNNNLFECFCGAPHGMTVGYKKNGDAIVPILSEKANPAFDIIKKQCELVEKFAASACLQKNLSLNTDFSKKLCGKLLCSLMYKPTAEQATALSAFGFCDDATENLIEPLCEPCPKSSLRCILLHNRFINKLKGRSVYPQKGIYWLYGTITLSDVKFKAAYRMSVRVWEKLRLLLERRRICR